MTLTPEQIQEYRTQYNIGSTGSTTTSPRASTLDGFKNSISETFSDIKQTGQDIKTTIIDTKNALKETKQSKQDGKQGGLRSVLQGAGILAGGLSNVVANITEGGVKSALTQKQEESVKGTMGKVVDPVVESDIVKNIVDRYSKLDEKSKRDIDAVMGIGSLVTDLVGGFGAKTATKKGLDVAEDAVTGAYNRAKKFIPEGTTYKSVDDFAQNAEKVLKDELPPLAPDATPSEILARAEAEAPIVTFKEKLIDLTPDIKKVIQGKPEKMAEYLDVVNARNLDINAPSAFEYGGDKARKAVEQMETLIKDTGSDIGSFRKKVGTYRAAPEQVVNIESTFTNELSRLNLELKNGVVQQIAGKPRKVAGKGDINTLNQLYGQIKVLKQDPNLTNLIDVRNLFTQNIDFGKRVGDVSDSLDGLSKSVRARLKETGATIVGKSEAQKLADYSDFMEALGDIRKYTDRNAGGEYLLRVLLSGRGGEARNIVKTINKYTGVDLTDDAVLMTLVTDMLGNQRQKNLFAQEITKAGLDVTRILSGDASTVIERAVQFAKDKYANVEDTLRQASQ